MAPKLTFFVLAACLATSVLAGSLPRKAVSLGKFSDGISDIFVDFVEKTLEGINYLFSETIYEVAYGIRELFSLFDELRDFGVQLSEDVVNKEIEILNSLIDKYKNETSESSQIILQCIVDTENEVVQVRRQAANYSLTCINSAIQIVGDGVMLILTDMKSLNEELKKEEETLSVCKTETSPITCVTDVFNKLGELAGKFANIIQTDGDKAQEDYDKLEIVIEKCVDETDAFVQKENERVYNDFSQCVAENQQH